MHASTLPGHHERDDGAAVVSEVAGEAGYGGTEPWQILQEQLLGSEGRGHPGL